jgi:SAM-dependent methyltransferase
VADRWYRRAFGAHYPLLYRHRDEAEAARCLALLPRLAPLRGEPARPILDLGCGDGRHLALLRQVGCAAVGLDLSADLLAFARSRGPGGLVRGDMRRLPFARRSFASVLSLFTAFGYFSTVTANQMPIHEVARVLVPGGHWFLDYFDGDKVREELAAPGPRTRERELGPLTVREEREFREIDSLVAKKVHLQPKPGCLDAAAGYGIPAEGLEYTEQVMVFTLEELDTMARQAGMTRVGSAGGYGGETLGRGNRWILAYQKATKDSIL